MRKLFILSLIFGLGEGLETQASEGPDPATCGCGWWKKKKKVRQVAPGASFRGPREHAFHLSEDLESRENIKPPTVAPWLGPKRERPKEGWKRGTFTLPRFSGPEHFQKVAAETIAPVSKVFSFGSEPGARPRRRAGGGGSFSSGETPDPYQTPSSTPSSISTVPSNRSPEDTLPPLQRSGGRRNLTAGIPSLELGTIESGRSKSSSEEKEIREINSAKFFQLATKHQTPEQKEKYDKAAQRVLSARTLKKISGDVHTPDAGTPESTPRMLDNIEGDSPQPLSDRREAFVAPSSSILAVHLTPKGQGSFGHLK